MANLLLNPKSRFPPFFRVYPITLFFILSLTIFTPISSLQIIPSFQIPSRISYSQHCAQIVGESPISGDPLVTSQIPSFFGAYVLNADQILGPNFRITAYLSPRNFYKTLSPEVFKIDAFLVVRTVRPRWKNRRNLLNVYGGPRFRLSPRVVNFHLSGFWDSGSGQLCMVGMGTKPITSGKPIEYDAVFKSIYPNNSSIGTSLITGTLESLINEGSNNHFRPISIMGISRMNYEYTLIKEDNETMLNSNVSMSNGGLLQNCYRFISLSDNFELSYKSSCDGRNCTLLDGLLGFLPKFMSLNEIDCSGQKMVRVAFGFSDTSDIRHGYRQPLNPARALVAEGTWNTRKNQFNFVACRILNFSDAPLSASIGDCSIRVNFTFPEFLTIRTPSIVNGHIWSNKSVSELGYFDTAEIHASGSRKAALPDMKYEYSEIERAKMYCSDNKFYKRKGKSYPNPYSPDMKFDMDVKNSKGQKLWGNAHPVFAGDRFVDDFNPFFASTVMARPETFAPVTEAVNGLLNMTYQLSFSPKGEFQVGGTSLMINRTIALSAEGVYDIESGRVCMVGCWNRETDGNFTQNKLDCDIFINIQFPAGDSKGGDVIKGTIESKREKSDALYFEHLDLSASSLTKTQVDSMFWRMDFEISMVLVSNTLTCIFVAVQLFHVKKHAEELPLISIVMLVLITLGHMIPLLLNMEAFFLSSPQKKTVLFGSGGWLEVNEVLVRVITMVAFLLEFRLLQLTWSSRGDNEENPNTTLWSSEKKVIYYAIPFYLFGALVAFLIGKLRHSPTNSSGFQQLRLRPNNPSFPLWQDIKSYAGFILDAFLLPQIMFNIFSDSKGTALCIPYYIGTMIVRLLPHCYDLFRGHIGSGINMDPWYIYANPGMNYYSTAWDILISCIGLLFVVVIFLQQRFGGKSVVPKRFRESATYEKVPIGL